MNQDMDKDRNKDKDEDQPQDASILILMSTYNGAQFLGAQLESIIAQSFKNWILLIRDDGSSDQTVELINQYCGTDPRICLHHDTHGNLKPAKSFAVLAEVAVHRSEPFIFLSDQDDIWLENKLAQQLAQLKALQVQYGAHTPILVHSDLRVVDSDLHVLHPSFMRYEKLTMQDAKLTMQDEKLKRITRTTRTTVCKNNCFIHSNRALQTLLINNFITGCTVGMNRALLRIANPIPNDCLMHDWWFGLCAATVGRIGTFAEATILYRQHPHNAIGSKGFYSKLNELKHFKNNFDKRRNNFRQCFKQAQQLMERFEWLGQLEIFEALEALEAQDNQLPMRIKNYKLIKQFVRMQNKNLLMRYLFAITTPLKPLGLLRYLSFWTLLAFA